MAPKTENFTFRIPTDLREKLEIRAAEEGRTLSNLIIYLLRKEMEK